MNLRGSLLLSFCLAFASQTFAQTSKVFDDLTLASKILDGDRKFAIYLPPGYDSSKRSYPVLYLLHGAGDDQTGWIQFGEVQHIADKAIAEGKATPMIIAMPDANTGRRGYFNNVDGSWRYEDFFFDEFIPFIEGEFRVKSDKRYRAVAGLSMGGGGSFMYALHRPEWFSSACPLSASTGPLSVEDMKSRLARDAKDDEVRVEHTDEAIEAYYHQHNAISLVNNLPDSQRTAVRWYIDCGDDDFLYEGNSLVHIAMRKREIPHEYRVRDGGHKWSYWRGALPTVLEFVSVSFHQD